MTLRPGGPARTNPLVDISLATSAHADECARQSTHVLTLCDRQVAPLQRGALTVLALLHHQGVDKPDHADECPGLI